jgi:hypothetical protein
MDPSERMLPPRAPVHFNTHYTSTTLQHYTSTLKKFDHTSSI